MMTCRRVTELTTVELAGELKFGHKLAVGFHRGLCAKCRRFRRQIAAVDRAVARHLRRAAPASADVRLSDETRVAMKRALELVAEDSE